MVLIFEAGKENRNTSDFDGEASGKPTSSADGNLPSDRRQIRKYITVKDGGLWEIIDEIATLPEYSKSFNKIINDALKYGLPELSDRLFNRKTSEREKPSEAVYHQPKQTAEADEKTVEFMEEVVALLKENIVDLTIIKSIASSLYNVTGLQLKGEPVPQIMYESGAYRRTPTYLEAYESRAYKQVRGGKK